MNNFELEKIVNQKLDILSFNDYAPNGLQIEGIEKITKIITGVTACQKLLDVAVSLNAHAVLVHHGYFWNNENPIITGMKKNRLKTLLTNEINLYSWHLPLDAHPNFGNNVQLAKLLDIKIQGNITPLILWGELNIPLNGQELLQFIYKKMKKKPLYFGSKKKYIKKIAICTGAGQKFIYDVIEFGVDAFITGEVSEQTLHVVRENNFHFFAAGHHATECGGIYALGEWLRRKYFLDVTFVNIYNPI